MGRSPSLAEEKKFGAGKSGVTSLRWEKGNSSWEKLANIEAGGDRSQKQKLL